MRIKTWGMSAGAVVWGMTFGGVAMAQAAGAAPPAAAPVPAAPQPAAAPPAAAPPPAQQGGVPPGYMLVPAQSPQPQTQYQVQYPQGALPPGMELPYEEGDPIPPGYRVSKQPRRGLITAGAIMTGVAWSFSLTGAVASDFDNKSGFLVVPVLGPWLMLATGGAKDQSCYDPGTSYNYCGTNSGLRAVLVLDGLVQTAGAIMIVAGIAVPKVRLVRQDITVGFTPTTFGNGSYGLGAAGTF